MAYKYAELLQVDKAENSLYQSGCGPAVCVAQSRALEIHGFWCCGQQGVELSQEGGYYRGRGTSDGALSTCLSRQEKQEFILLPSCDRSNPSTASHV